MLPFSIDDILAALQKVMEAFKQIMAWLGILVLPEDGEYDAYPTTTEWQPSTTENGAEG